MCNVRIKIYSTRVRLTTDQHCPTARRCDTVPYHATVRDEMRKQTTWPNATHNKEPNETERTGYYIWFERTREPKVPLRTHGPGMQACPPSPGLNITDYQIIFSEPGRT